MSKTAPRFKRAFSLFYAVLMTVSFCLPAGTARAASELAEIKKNDSGFYKDAFDHNFYYDNTSWLRFDRLARAITGKKLPSANVNIYDEVADSNFFTNRHGRKSLSADELTKGFQENDGPDLSGALKITRGELNGLRPKFVVRDSRGDEYTLTFDMPDSFGLMTGAAVVASRFYHALGYNVPQNTIAFFSPDKLVTDENSRVVDTTGFEKKLVKEKLDEMLLLIPWGEDGRFRALAVKTPAGVDKGPFNYQGRRKKDPEDVWPHERMRELRALRVFSSLINNFNVRNDNTRDYLVEENGKQFLKHYLTGFEGSLGADLDGTKRPMIGHEYLYDARETGKAFWAFGFYKKPWQKRWEENGEKTKNPAVGYLDNHQFKAGNFKTLLPQYTFKDITRADGFWAARILKKFSDADLRALVKSGQYTAEDEEEIVKVLIERRDMILNYWFENSAPLDSFDYKNGEIVFEDLSGKGSAWKVEVTAKNGKKRSSLASFETSTPSFKVNPEWLQGHEETEFWIRTAPASSKNPYALVRLNAKGLAGVAHED